MNNHTVNPGNFNQGNIQNLMTNGAKPQRNPALATKDGTNANKQDSEVIVIHVFDENRNINKDF